MEPRGRRNVFLIIVIALYYVLVTSLVLSVGAAATNSCEFPAIFNFGDSNSDTGAENLRLPYLSPFLDALGSNFSHEANFASAGSTIRPQNLTQQQSGFSPMNLNVQHTEFNDFHRRSQIIRKKGGVFGELMPKDEDFSRALYTFDIGQNDLSGGYFANMTADQIKAIVPELIDQLTAPIKDMYDQGGRSFWIHNTGPFGCSPAALETFLITGGQIDEVGCSIPYNEVAQLFNSKLKEALVQLRKELPEAALTCVDVYTIKYDLISHAKKHGFQQPLTSCCGYGGKYKYSPYYGCGRNVTLHDIKVSVGSCKDPSVMVNWDGIHYTEAANKWIAERIISGLYSDPPIPLKMACHRELDINLVTPY